MSFLTGNGAENALSCFLKIKYDFIFQWFSEQKKKEKKKKKNDNEGNFHLNIKYLRSNLTL